MKFRRQLGMTLLELTVVIVVLLTLITILLIGANAWKRAADRSSAIIIIRASQMGMRSLSRVSKVESGPLPGLANGVFGSDTFVYNGSGVPGQLPLHPAADQGQSFGFVASDGDLVPPIGTLYICTGGAAQLNNSDYNPHAEVYAGW